MIGLSWVLVRVLATGHLHRRILKIAWVTCASVFILLLPPPENAFISLSTCSIYVGCPQSKTHFPILTFNIFCVLILILMAFFSINLIILCLFCWFFFCCYSYVGLERELFLFDSIAILFGYFAPNVFECQKQQLALSGESTFNCFVWFRSSFFLFFLLFCVSFDWVVAVALVHRRATIATQTHWSNLSFKMAVVAGCCLDAAIYVLLLLVIRTPSIHSTFLLANVVSRIVFRWQTLETHV